MYDNIVEFFDHAKSEIINQGYESEINTVDNRKFEDVDARYFLDEFIFVVLSAGKSNKAVQTISKKIRDNNFDLLLIGHSGKITAIIEAVNNHVEWFQELKSKETLDDKLEYLESKPFIGKITKYHLARNLGLDCAKPDVHLVRLANRFGFFDVEQMCEYVSGETGNRIGTVDVILWRYCNLFGSN